MALQSTDQGNIRLSRFANITRVGVYHTGKLSPAPDDLVVVKDEDDSAGSVNPQAKRAAKLSKHSSGHSVISINDDSESEQKPAVLPSVRRDETKVVAVRKKDGGVPEPKFEAKDTKMQGGVGHGFSEFMSATGQFMTAQTVVLKQRESRAEEMFKLQKGKDKVAVAKDLVADPNVPAEIRERAQKVIQEFLDL